MTIIFHLTFNDLFEPALKQPFLSSPMISFLPTQALHPPPSWPYCCFQHRQPHHTSSYPTDRQQYISINNNNSSTALLSQGVPQGSVLETLLFFYFLFCTRSRLVISSAIMVFISITSSTCITLSNCLTELKAWMDSKFLKLNYDRPDFNSTTRTALFYLKNITRLRSSLPL